MQYNLTFNLYHILKVLLWGNNDCIFLSLVYHFILNFEAGSQFLASVSLELSI